MFVQATYGILGNRTFPVFVAKLWNELPPEITFTSLFSVFRHCQVLSLPVRLFRLLYPDQLI